MIMASEEGYDGFPTDAAAEVELEDDAGDAAVVPAVTADADEMHEHIRGQDMDIYLLLVLMWFPTTGMPFLTSFKSDHLIAATYMLYMIVVMEITLLCILVAILQIWLPITLLRWYQMDSFTFGRGGLNATATAVVIDGQLCIQPSSQMQNELWALWFGVPFALIALFGLGQTYRGTLCARGLWNSRKELPRFKVLQDICFLLAILTSWFTYGASVFLAYCVITSKDAYSGGITFPPLVDILKDVVALT